MKTATLTPEMRRMAMRPAKDEYRWNNDGTDAWGFALGEWFAIAEVAYHGGADLPPEWQFRHGANNHDPIATWHPHNTPCPNAYEPNKNWGTEDQPVYECECDHRELEYVPFLDAGEAGIEMLIYAGRVIDRYCRWLKRKGLDY